MKILIEIRGGMIQRVATDPMDEEVEVFIQDWDLTKRLEPEATEAEVLTYQEQLLLNED